MLVDAGATIENRCLHLAVKGRDAFSVHKLLNGRNAQDSDVLALAVSSGNGEILQMCFDANFTPVLRALEVAVRQVDETATAALLDAGLKPTKDIAALAESDGSFGADHELSQRMRALVE